MSAVAVLNLVANAVCLKLTIFLRSASRVLRSARRELVLAVP